jgi:hypothetical protein
VNYLASVSDDDVTETDIYQDIVRNEATDSLTDAVRAGNVSQMQYAVGMVSNENDAASAGTRAWMRNVLLDEAYVGMIVGGMGSGKTAFALDRADDWHHATRGRVVTNIESATERNDVPEYVSGYADVEEAFTTARTHILAIIDETDQRLTGKGSDQQAGEKLAKMLKLVRKGEAPAGTYRAFLLVGQTVKGATKELRRLVTSNGHLWRKTSKTKVEIYDDITSGELGNKKPLRKIKGLNDTRWDYDTGEESTFKMGGSGSGGDDDEDDDSQELTREQAIEAVLRAVKPWNDDLGVPQRDAGDIVGYSAGWVNDRVREWRNGQHRNLVPDPLESDD